jgi:hypothetical protein
MSAEVRAFPQPFLRWCAKALGPAPGPTRAGADLRVTALREPTAPSEPLWFARP